jgi:D-glycero-D-manno-heptose 1,7-bisphosphate phosphatase
MKAVFLDRDGVINENRDDHVKSWDEFTFIPGALTALRMLRHAGFHVFVVTNQAIVERGVVSPQTIEDIHERMAAEVLSHGGLIHDIRYCPHDSHSNCSCRKPQPGMLLDLAARWNVDVGRSYMIGDALTDMTAGHALTCRCILVQTGRGAEQLRLPEAKQYPVDWVATNLLSAVTWLFSQEGLSRPYHHDATSRVRQPTIVDRGVAIPVSG